MRNAKLLRQRFAARWIFDFIENDFCRRASGVVFAGAEEIGVITLPFVADQLLQLLKGESGDTRELTAALAF